MVIQSVQREREREGEGEREKERQRHAETDRERHRQTDRVSKKIIRSRLTPPFSTPIDWETLNVVDTTTLDTPPSTRQHDRPG